VLHGLRVRLAPREGGGVTDETIKKFHDHAKKTLEDNKEWLDGGGRAIVVGISAKTLLEMTELAAVGRVVQKALEA
jgi:hypothetical protein